MARDDLPALTLERPATVYAATIVGADVYVIGPDNSRLCSIPMLPHQTSTQLRSEQERFSIAQQLAWLLNQESERCNG